MFKNILDKYDSSGSLGNKMAAAVVVDNNDPEKLQRVKCRVSDLHTGRNDSDLAWSTKFGISAQGNTGKIGEIGLPPIGAKVILFFPEDDEHDTYYIADMHDKSTQIAELLVDYPNVYGHIDASNNLWMVNTLQDTVLFVHGPSGSSYKYLKNGDVEHYVAGDFRMHVAGNYNVDAAIFNLQKGEASSVTGSPRPKPAVTPPTSDY
jgi:hypothetical protein